MLSLVSWHVEEDINDLYSPCSQQLVDARAYHTGFPRLRVHIEHFYQAVYGIVMIWKMADIG